MFRFIYKVLLRLGFMGRRGLRVFGDYGVDRLELLIEMRILGEGYT